MEPFENSEDQLGVYRRNQKLHRDFPTWNKGYLSTVLIKRNSVESENIGCGFLAEFSVKGRLKNVYTLITCHHVIPEDTIKPEEKIELIQERPETGEVVRFSMDISQAVSN